MELGVAGTIAVKQFGADYGLDDQINAWLQENQDVEVLDIKFTSSATESDWSTNALLIYRKED